MGQNEGLYIQMPKQAAAGSRAHQHRAIRMRFTGDSLVQGSNPDIT
jgi:hypothetical protein